MIDPTPTPGTGGVAGQQRRAIVLASLALASALVALALDLVPLLLGC